ncbi:Phosphoribosylaminoimidazole-succinocarboxamide synthase [Nadsonia fulvescens var. elongata DSM 6958]|uniref:Phosphoribosylaminoimidazole-succinocarboxamide synthase n=1 Tax=Nadsonia fulvescens var. elongata DSM 6958 TaxID=857566 RepID=A0A1E3PRE7_9ASCO|nr:Phosphoribosylaminoimidazole-succinocarboxamide synthase [Nadsonia fulvescens var. elongata DSM 6958]
MSVVTTTDLKGALPLLARGKVRDLYSVNDTTLLFVATDRISAYDVIMTNGVPSKGKILTKISEFWFDFLKDDVKIHLADSVDIFSALPEQISSDSELKSQVEGRSLLVNKYKILPLEVIVRGYITGSAWSEYKKSGTVHGMKVKEGLQESEAFETPIYTPSTKAEQGEHDENIHPDEAVKLVGPELARKVEEVAIALYTKARAYAASRGVIIADTKFEFGVDKDNNLVLVDEVLTPDSSRFWNASTYKIGQGQDSYDKQFLRDWLTSNNLKGVDGVTMPEDIVVRTKEKYVEAFEALTDKKWNE